MKEKGKKYLTSKLQTRHGSGKKKKKKKEEVVAKVEALEQLHLYL